MSQRDEIGLFERAKASLLTIYRSLPSPIRDALTIVCAGWALVEVIDKYISLAGWVRFFLDIWRQTTEWLWEPILDLLNLSLTPVERANLNYAVFLNLMILSVVLQSSRNGQFMSLKLQALYSSALWLLLVFMILTFQFHALNGSRDGQYLTIITTSQSVTFTAFLIWGSRTRPQFLRNLCARILTVIVLAALLVLIGWSARYF